MTLVSHRRFLAEEYERMAEVGILGEDDRVELIDGEIVEMSPIGGRHVGCVNALADLLAEQVRREVLISVQNPIRLGSNQEPQPDIALVRRGAPRNSVPAAADVLVVIEVADTSLEYDRGVKLPLYAAAGIEESWLVDLVAEIVERHTEPQDGVYRRIAPARRGETLSSTVLPGMTVSVDDILG